MGTPSYLKLIFNGRSYYIYYHWGDDLFKNFYFVIQGIFHRYGSFEDFRQYFNILEIIDCKSRQERDDKCPMDLNFISYYGGIPDFGYRDHSSAIIFVILNLDKAELLLTKTEDYEYCYDIYDKIKISNEGLKEFSFRYPTINDIDIEWDKINNEENDELLRLLYRREGSLRKVIENFKKVYIVNSLTKSGLTQKVFHDEAYANKMVLKIPGSFITTCNVV